MLQQERQTMRTTLAIPSNHSQNIGFKPNVCLILDCDQNLMSSDSGQDISTRQILGHSFNIRPGKFSRTDEQNEERTDQQSVGQSVGRSITWAIHPPYWHFHRS